MEFLLPPANISDHSLALVSYHCLQSAIGSAARLRFSSLTSELSFLLINLALSGSYARAIAFVRLIILGLARVL